MTKSLVFNIDYNHQPINIGDFVLNILVCYVICKESNIKHVDVNIICDPELDHADPQISALLSPSNKKRKLFDIIQLLQLFPRIGSIKFYRQVSELIEYMETNANDCQVFWPSLEKLFNHEYVFYDAVRIVSNYIVSTKSYPKLKFSDFDTNYAIKFYKKHVYPHVPVTVNLRNNPFFHSDRNALLEEWKDFFLMAADKYPVKFVIVSSFGEIDDEISKLKNVTYAKQYCTSLVDDLSLLQYSAFHLGNPSGPSLLIYYSGKPYYIFNWNPQLHLYRGILSGDTESLRYIFATPYQNFGIRPETSGDICRQFEKIWNSRDWLEWAFVEFYKQKVADIPYWF